VTLTTVKVLDVVLYSIIAWYIFQIASRKKGRLWFKTKCMIVSLLVY